MTWSELIEAQLVVSMNSNHFTLWNFFAQFSYRLEQHWLVCSFKVLVLFSIEKSDEVRDGRNPESLSTISCHLRVYCNEDEIWILIGLRSAFESRLDSHTWWAGWTPKVNDDCRSFLNQLLKN